MTSELRELYQETILDHNKKPRNFYKAERVSDVDGQAPPEKGVRPLEPAKANHTADGFNPLCGDRISIYLKIEDGIVKDISFTGKGCAISTASASMMTEIVKGMTLAKAEKLFERFHHLLTKGEDKAASEQTPPLGKLAVFSGVREFPVRVKCATLPWHTLHAALKDTHEVVTTE